MIAEELPLAGEIGSCTGCTPTVLAEGTILGSSTFAPAVPRRAISVLQPQLPSADRLLPYLRQIDERRYYSNHGALVLELERRLAEHLSIPPGGIATAASGTSALMGAILACAGRATPRRPFALIPSYTFVATAVAVELCGYRPFLADIDPESWMLDVRKISEAPERDRIGLVVPVAPFGRPVPLEVWSAFQERTGIRVVVDGAASFEGLGEDPGRYLGKSPSRSASTQRRALRRARGARSRRRTSILQREQCRYLISVLKTAEIALFQAPTAR